MEWSMPPKVLKIVAGVIAVAAVGSFTLGVVGAPHRGRLPGERAGDTAGTLIEAAEATPLSQERIEGPPPPRALTEEERAKLEADKLARAEAESAQKLAAAEVAAPRIALPPAAPGDRVGDLLDSVTPPPPSDDPPH